MNMPYLGESAALLTAMIWAFAVILFKKSGETVHPIALNLFKDVLGAVLILPTLYLLGGTIVYPAPANEYFILLASGALGIGVSDTLFFRSLNLLGAGLSAIVDCLYSPFIIALSMIWLGERMTLLQGVGVLMILSAVFTATFERNHRTLTRRNLILGILFGVLAMATMAVGVVMVKPILNRTPLLWVTEIRLLGGLVMLGAILLLHSDRRTILSSLAVTKGWKYMLSGSVLGAYFSLILWLAGMKYTNASIAAALNQTSNIFVFLFAALILKEVINLQRVIGILLGVTGVFVVMFG